MFACIDGATGCILGFSIGNPDRSRPAYAAAAADALARLGGIAPRLGWAPRLARAQLTPGTDRAAWSAFFPEAAAVTFADVQEKGDGRRVGRDLRTLIGDTLGSIRLLPARTFVREPLTMSVGGAELSAAEAKARLEVEVVAHNGAQILLQGKGGGMPPDGVTELLRLLTTMPLGPEANNERD